MIKKIEHLGIAVASIDASLPVFEKLLGKKMYKTEIVESEAVKTVFIELGESKIELLEATDPSSSIAKFLKKNREGFHHLALDVEDIEFEIAHQPNTAIKTIIQPNKLSKISLCDLNRR